MGYTGPNNRRYETPRKWWLPLGVLSAAAGALWGWLHLRRRSASRDSATRKKG